MRPVFPLFTLLFLLLLTHQSNAQSDAAKKTLYHTLNFGATGTMNITASDRVYLFNNNIGYKTTVNRLEFNASVKWIYGNNNAGLTNNDFNGILDANYYHNKSKTLNSWILGSFNSSYALNILSEYQAGFGLAWRLLDTPQSKYVFLRLSNGIIVENSDYINTEGHQENYNTIRNSMRVQWNMRFLDNRIRYTSTFYWQPSFNIVSDYNLRLQTRVNIPIYKEITFETRFEYNYIARTSRENTFLSYGINYSIKF